MIEVHDCGSHWEVIRPYCTITIEKRPPWCDRGRYIAKVFPIGSFVMEFDSQDGWPRYYFGWDGMLVEIEEWLKIRDRGQWKGPLPGPRPRVSSGG